MHCAAEPGKLPEPRAHSQANKLQVLHKSWAHDVTCNSFSHPLTSPVASVPEGLSQVPATHTKADDVRRSYVWQAATAMLGCAVELMQQHTISTAQPDDWNGA